MYLSRTKTQKNSFNIFKFKRSHLDKYSITFTSNPNYTVDPIDQYGNYGFGLEKFCCNTKLDLIPQYLNTGIYNKYDFDTNNRCRTNSEGYLLGHDIIFFDIDNSDNVTIVCDKLNRYSIPFTCIVDTGHDNRAHIIVALKDMFPYRTYQSKKDRKILNEKMRVLLTHYNKSLIDEAVLVNPVAFVRAPGAYRIDTGKFQVAVQGGSGQAIPTSRFINAINQAYKRKVRESRKVKAKNKGIYKKKDTQKNKKKDSYFKKIAKDPKCIFSPQAIPYKKLMQKMQREEKPTYEAIPFMVSHVLRRNVSQSNRLEALKTLISEYSDKGNKSKYLKDEKQLLRVLKTGELHSIKRHYAVKNQNMLEDKKDYEKEQPVLQKAKRIISNWAENNINELRVEKLQKLLEYIFCSDIQGQGIFSSAVMARICGSSYKKHLECLETMGLIKKTCDKYWPGVYTKKYEVIDFYKNKQSPGRQLIAGTEKRTELKRYLG